MAVPGEPPSVHYRGKVYCEDRCPLLNSGGFVTWNSNKPQSGSVSRLDSGRIQQAFLLKLWPSLGAGGVQVFPSALRKPSVLGCSLKTPLLGTGSGHLSLLPHTCTVDSSLLGRLHLCADSICLLWRELSGFTY